jgi:tetratricopeptide (TPR) repeat protein
VEKDSSIGGFMRFVFRRSGSLIGLYIGLVFAYGSLGYFNSRLELESIKRILTGVVAASGLLHFYYDGFIWKMRERSTRESLGLSGGSVASNAMQLLPGWSLHGLKWAVAFVVPAAALWLGETHSRIPREQRAGWVATDFPNESRALAKYGGALGRAGRPDESVAQYRAAIRLDPNDGDAHFNLGTTLISQAKFDAAAAELGEAVRLEPDSSEFYYDYGYALERVGRLDEARAAYATAVSRKPHSALFRIRYAAFLKSAHETAAAKSQYSEALRYEPNNATAHADLAGLLFAENDLAGAEEHYNSALRLNPNRADARNNLGSVYLREGKNTLAIIQYQEALRIDPKFAEAEENLRLAQGGERFRSRARGNQ